MALGSVSISTFIPGELDDLTGTVSIIPFTRAEIERLANKKAYPDGKLVWSSNGLTSSSGGGSSVTVPDEVDYVVVNGQKLTRGGNATVSGEVYNWAGNRHEIAYSTVTFSGNTLSISKHGAYSGSFLATATGYHYY